MNYLIRILILPFILAIYAIHFIHALCRAGIFFVLYGGETFIYEKKDKKTIAGIYDMLKAYQKTPSELIKDINDML